MDPLAQFNQLRPLLFGLAYRALGTRADAEDVLQDAFLRWQSAPAEGIRSPKAYLTTTVARLSLDALKSARRKRETYVGTWLPEPLIAEPAPDNLELAESLSQAFLHLLEQLSPAERVAFLLHEIFESSYEEVAATLATSEENSRQLVSRARRHLRERRPRYQVDAQRHAEMLRAFLEACRDFDVGRLTNMLAADVVAYNDGGGKAPAALNPIVGLDKVLRLLMGIQKKAPERVHAGYPAMINGEPGFVFTIDGEPSSTLTLDLDEQGHIRAIYFVANPDKIRQPRGMI